MSILPPKELSANLDFLRAVAVLLVFLSHFSMPHHNNLGITGLGIFGVVIFFVHTSFVLMASLERLEKTAGNDRSLVLAFWIRRIFRIYPLAIFFVVLVVIFHIPISIDGIYTWIGLKGFLSNLALIQNLTGSKDTISVLWTLPIEMQMYLILPFAYFAIRGDRHLRSLALWVLSVLLAFSSLLFFKNLSLFFYAPCFTSGIVAFDLVHCKSRKWKLPAWSWPIGIFSIIALTGPHYEVISGTKFLRAWVLSLLLGVLYANVEESRPNWTHKLFHWISEHSYGIYLSHVFVFWFAFCQMDRFPLWTQFMALIIGAIGVPAILYISIEKPMILAGGHLARRLLRHSALRKERQLARR
ncbi:MAG: acyltransferase [Terracidiphilus sp.]|jgi:peptidoglycan/LPS O-acetylase OafA/YrhL